MLHITLLAALGAIRTMACGGRRAARYGPRSLELGFAWVGNAILCPNQHEFADLDHCDQHDRNERQFDLHRGQGADVSLVGQQCAAALGNVGLRSESPAPTLSLTITFTTASPAPRTPTWLRRAPTPRCPSPTWSRAPPIISPLRPLIPPAWRVIIPRKFLPSSHCCD